MADFIDCAVCDIFGLDFSLFPLDLSISECVCDCIYDYDSLLSNKVSLLLLKSFNLFFNFVYLGVKLFYESRILDVCFLGSFIRAD